MGVPSVTGMTPRQASLLWWAVGSTTLNSILLILRFTGVLH